MAEEPIQSPDPDQVHAERIRRLLAFAVDVSLGTVWQVREDVWDSEIREYDHESTRKWHPGVSLRTGPLDNLNEAVPMLHGTTGTHGPVVVQGLTEDLGPNHQTSFGHLVSPARIGLENILFRDPEADPEQTSGQWFRRKRVASNLHKPRLNESETADLKDWARRRDLL